MAKDKGIKKIIIWVIVFTIVLFGLFGLFKFVHGNKQTESLLISDKAVNKLIDNDLLLLLLKVKAIKLDGNIFSDKAFLQLKDFGTAIKSQPIGRSNPFSPLESNKEIEKVQDN